MALMSNSLRAEPEKDLTWQHGGQQGVLSQPQVLCESATAMAMAAAHAMQAAFAKANLCYISSCWL